MTILNFNDNYLFFERSIVTISTSPPIGGFILETATVASVTIINSLNILFKIRSATCYKSLDLIAISSSTIKFK